MPAVIEETELIVDTLPILINQLTRDNSNHTPVFKGIAKLNSALQSIKQCAAKGNSKRIQGFNKKFIPLHDKMLSLAQAQDQTQEAKSKQRHTGISSSIPAPSSTVSPSPAGGSQ